MDTERLLRDNVNLVYRVIHDLTYIPDKIEMEDLEQVGKIALWKAIEDFNFELGNFSSYAYNRIKTDILDYLKKAQAKKRKRVKYDPNPYTDSFENEVVNKVLIEEIKKYVSELEYKILILRYIEGYTRQKVADKLGLSIWQVDRLTKQAKETLKNKLEVDNL